MSGADPPYGSGLPSNPSPASQQQVVGDMRLNYNADGAAVYKPVAAAVSPTYHQPGNGSVHGDEIGLGLTGEPVKRKRGRPRKYAPDGGGPASLGLAPSPSQVLPLPPPPPAHSGGFASPPAVGMAQPTAGRKGRGRPPGSGRKHRMAAVGAAAVGFAPHIIAVKAGEDVSAKIMSFSQNGPRSVCILSANGAISNVTLYQAATSGGTVTYEGRFEILSLSGSFLLSDSSGQRSRTGGLSVSLAGPDGRVLGGGVAGLLTAASSVQVVVASFTAEGLKESRSSGNLPDPLSAPSRYVPGVSAGESPPSRGTISGSSGIALSPLSHSTGACNNSQGLGNVPWK
ncbi:AT-hook motif nuclear-localized protein 10-like isoform X2 [Rhodamnia argentea]|nr:AT-hook motif nuclear-localized protein 10-like isoform X2 [Rhodamnia argentea]